VAEILIILLLLVINGLFSMSEIALVSSKKTRLELARQRGDKKAKLALDLANSPEKFLSTVQIGITLIGILTGVFSGENITQDMEALYGRYELLAPYRETLATTTVVIIITFFSLVIGELVPKRIGLSNPEGIAKAVAGPMNILSKATAPFVWLLSVSGNLLIRVFGIKPISQQQVTEEEIRAMVQEGAHAGVIREIEQDIVERVFHLGDRRAVTLMTPRQEIDWLNAHDPREENLRKIIENNHTVYPLCDEELDKVIGVIHIKDVVAALERGEEIDLMKMKREVAFVPEVIKSYRVLEKFKESRKHYAMVVDEYGGVSGIITMNDIMDALVGDMPEGDDTDYQIVKREDGSFLIDGQLPIEEFMNYFDLEVAPEEYSAFHTLAGLAMYSLKRIPKTGDVFEWMGYRFEIMDMDANRVDKMLIKKPK
jgi:putative hemolysin